MQKKQFGIRLRPDQEAKIDRMVADDPELDRSKIIRRAIDEFLAHRKLLLNEEPPAVKKKRRSSG